MKKGNCFQNAGNAIIEYGNNFVLVHGLPTGTGGLVEGRQFAHAWIENPDSGNVYDTEADLIIPIELYYAIGQIEYAVKYDYQSAQKMMLKTGNYGPWDDAISGVDQLTVQHIEANHDN